ncbi:uncharacterized protein LOC126237373 isoform X1 [Schistocerca nitens]|uniref:uncharacterized protein LOC126237373 isoform X1 n=1 Tax=Schistocerca nitens TaxID=7011 RepID=UPI002117A9E6|nr:uncharacterized protein LOC126237373 isoform X1 [Schistocerca nitens]
MASACSLFLLAVTVAAAGGTPADHCRPSCPQLLPQLSGMVRWCRTRPLAGSITDTVADCFKKPSSFNQGYMIIGASSDYEDIVRDDSKWMVCVAGGLGHETEAYFGAVWDPSEGLCPEKYTTWVATYNAPPCWHYNYSSAEGTTVNQQQAAALPANEIYRCTHCSFGSTENSTLGNHVLAEESYTYVIIKDGSPQVFRYLSCNVNDTQNFPTLKAMNVTEFTCEECHEWIKVASDCETGQKQGSSKSTCESEQVPPTTLLPADHTTVPLSRQQTTATLSTEKVATTRLTEGTTTTMSTEQKATTLLTEGTTTTMSTEQTTTNSLSTKWTPDPKITQPPQSTESKYTKPDGNDRLATRDAVQDALEQLKSRNFTDDDLKNPVNMLNKLEIVVTSMNNQTRKEALKREVSLALEGFERFSMKILRDNLKSGRRLVTVEHGNFTLVVASGVVGTLVSDSGERIKLLPQGEGWTVEGVLALPSSVGVLLDLGPGASAAGVAITVFPLDIAGNAFSQQEFHLNSDVISVQVAALNSSLSINHVDIFLRPRVVGVRRRCGVCDLTTKTWDFSVCQLHHRGQTTDVCRCRHLTHIAQLVTDADLQWGDHARPLETLSLVGIGASLLGALGLAVTAALAGRWRRKAGTRMLLQLGSAVAARDLLLALAAVDAFRPSWLWRPQDPDACRWLGVALHYALLAAATWTTAAAVWQLLRLGTIGGPQAMFPHLVLVSSACSWLSALVPVVALVATSGLEAGYPLRQDSATDFLCYPQGVALYTTVVFPVALCTAANAAIFLYLLLAVLFPVCQEDIDLGIRQRSTAQLRRRTLYAVMLFFLLGLPWLLGPPARVPALAYLFCIVATPQGMALFVFFVLCNGQLRSSLRAWVSRVVWCWPSSGRLPGYQLSTTTTNTTRIKDSFSDHTPLVRQRLNRLQEHLELDLKKRSNKPA